MTETTGSGADTGASLPEHGVPPSPLSRIFAALSLSRRAFLPPIRTVDWLVPLLILLAFQVVSGVLLHDLYMDKALEQQQEVRAQIQDNPNMSAEQKEATLERMERMGGGAGVWASTLAGPVFGVLLLNLLLSVLLLLVVNFILGGESRFRALWFVASLSWAPAIIGTILRVPLSLARSTIDVAFGPAAFVQNDGGALYRALQVFDVFDVWRLAVVIVGLQVVSRLSSSKATGGALAIWILGWLVAIGFTMLARGMPGTG